MNLFKRLFGKEELPAATTELQELCNSIKAMNEKESRTIYIPLFKYKAYGNDRATGKGKVIEVTGVDDCEALENARKIILCNHVQKIQQ